MFLHDGTGAAEGNSPVEVGDVTSVVLTGLTAAEEYYLAVTACNDVGDESFYSAEQKVTLLPPPSDLQETSPDNDSTPKFTWASAEGAAAYQVSMDDEEFTNIGSVLTYAHRSQLTDGTHTFRVRTRHISGSVSAEASLEFTVDTENPTAPGELTMDPMSFTIFTIDAEEFGGPRELTMEPASPINDPTPASSWLPVEDSASYQVRVDGGTFTDIGNSSEFLVNDPLSHGAHTIRVRSADGEGARSKTAVLEFTVDTESPTAPTRPNLMTPNTDGTPTFEWAAATDGEGSGAGHYEYALDQIGNFVDIDDVLDYTFPNFLGSGSHFFEVRAVDQAGNAGASLVRFFTLDVPNIPMPGNLTMDPTSPSSDSTPTFGWTAMENTAFYEVSIDGSEITDVGDATEYQISGLLLDGVHSFSVRAADNLENSSLSAVLGFSVDTTSPPLPGNLQRTSPAGNPTPTFTWEAAVDETSGARHHDQHRGQGYHCPDCRPSAIMGHI